MYILIREVALHRSVLMLIFCDHWLWPLVMLIQTVQQGEGSENEDCHPAHTDFVHYTSRKMLQIPKLKLNSITLKFKFKFWFILLIHSSFQYIDYASVHSYMIDILNLTATLILRLWKHDLFHHFSPSGEMTLSWWKKRISAVEFIGHELTM